LENTAEVEDPIMRLFSKTRRICGSAALDRSHGEFTKSEKDAAEPERTERLLAAPFTLFHTRAGDAHDAISLFWLARSTGNGLPGSFYDFVCYMVMLALAVVYGLENVVAERGEGAQRAQAISVLSLQMGLALYVFVLRPSVDRLENVQNWLQMGFEGAATFLLLLPLFVPDVPVSTSSVAAFFGTLIAVFIPILTKLYDVLIVPLVAWRADGGTLASLGPLLVATIIAIPACAHTLSAQYLLCQPL
jgi:hypothetical protein